MRITMEAHEPYEGVQKMLAAIVDTLDEADGGSEKGKFLVRAIQGDPEMGFHFDVDIPAAYSEFVAEFGMIVANLLAGSARVAALADNLPKITLNNFASLIAKIGGISATMQKDPDAKPVNGKQPRILKRQFLMALDEEVGAKRLEDLEIHHRQLSSNAESKEDAIYHTTLANAHKVMAKKMNELARPKREKMNAELAREALLEDCRVRRKRHLKNAAEAEPGDDRHAHSIKVYRREKKLADEIMNEAVRIKQLSGPDLEAYRADLNMARAKSGKAAI